MHAFLTQCGYYVGKWKILSIADEGVNSKTRARLGYWDFHGKNVNKARYLLEQITQDSFEFEKATCVSRYSCFDPYAFYARSYYAPFWCCLCHSSDYNINSCPYYTYYAQPDFASPSDNTDFVLTLPDSSFLSAQCGARGT